ncbi:hypothetical protein Scep_024404 [Stephania cephalantha]|uniref:Uncharacterized protein n=1 Tax=Stephania cephalantha TaxID=152367 RepID=A0AAP0F5E4_9MAGN
MDEGATTHVADDDRAATVVGDDDDGDDGGVASLARICMATMEILACWERQNGFAGRGGEPRNPLALLAGPVSILVTIAGPSCSKGSSKGKEPILGDFL